MQTALTVKYITRRFINEYDPELGKIFFQFRFNRKATKHLISVIDNKQKEDTYSKPEQVDNQDILVRIMDTCDKEGKDPERYLKWADGYLVIYSITQVKYHTN